MENRQSDNSPDKFEVVEVFRVDTRVRVDLKSVVVVSGVFEQTIERVEHFMRQEEEEFAGQIVRAYRR